MHVSSEEARKILAEADELFSAGQVQEAVRRVANEIEKRLADSEPLVLAVMNGALPFAGSLITQLRFPLDFDYLHATRYGDATKGGELSWLVEPQQPVEGRTVLLVDDILDQGITLAAIRQRILKMGAKACYIAVFSEKDLGHEKPVQADFVGVKLPNRFVFGFGMDVKGAWRNLPAVYAVKGM